jgi:hypothetical protein
MMKRAVLLTMLAFLLFLTFSVMAETSPQCFESPEDALIFFAQKVSEGDLEATLSAMDAKAAAENGDYRALAELIQAIMPSSSLILPEEYAEYVPLNESRIRAQQGQQLYGFVLSLLVPEYTSQNTPLMIKDGMIQFPGGGGSMSLDDFIARLNPKNLSTLTLRQIFRLNSARYLSVTTQTYLKKQGAIFGFNEQIDMLAIYELNGQLYRHACTAVERHGGWQLSGLNSPIIGTDAMGSAEPITQEEADALLHSDDYLLFYDIIFND